MVIQVAVAVLSEIGELLELSATCQKCAVAKRATQATCTGGKNLRNSKSLKNLKNFRIREKKKKKKRKKESQNRTEEQQQGIIGKEGYRQPGEIMTFPGPASTTTEYRGLAHGMYNRRLLMPMLLPRFAGVPFFRRRDTTEFLEQYNKLCNRYRLVKEQKVVKLL